MALSRPSVFSGLAALRVAPAQFLNIGGKPRKDTKIGKVW
jgi:hypothetical protein